MDNGASGRHPDSATLESDRAQLSALAATLDDLSDRVTTVAGRYQGTAREDISHSLYEAERSLLAASRKLEKTMRLLR